MGAHQTRSGATSVLAVPERVRTALRMLTAAANAGDPCPTNRELMEAIGAQTISGGANVVHFLEVAGIIRVTRFSCQRQITIVATGKSTAIVGKPNRHWREAGVQPEREAERQTRRVRTGVEDQARTSKIDVATCPPILDRDPCFKCGARHDLGCVHRAASEPERLAA